MSLSSARTPWVRKGASRAWGFFTILLCAVGCLAHVLVPRPSAAKDAARVTCPSLSGDWSGHFEGSASGAWHAIFTQSGDTLSAVATIVIRQYGQATATGTATVTCDHGAARIEGTGTARGLSGRFRGIADKQGKSIHGSWSGGRLRGTWQGSR